MKRKEKTSSNAKFELFLITIFLGACGVKGKPQPPLQPPQLKTEKFFQPKPSSGPLTKDTPDSKSEETRGKKNENNKRN